MIFRVEKCAKNIHKLLNSSTSRAVIHAFARIQSYSCLSSPLESSSLTQHKHQQCQDSKRLSELDILVAKVPFGTSDDEVLRSLSHDQACNSIGLSSDLVEKLLHRFKDDWKSALGVFKWAESQYGYKHTPEAYEMLVDILGKMKQMDKMKSILEEMNRFHVVRTDTVAKVMRRFCGAGQWEEAVRTFDRLGTFGLEKNTESMNLLLDTLCKESKVELAREVFLELKSHISPNALTFNIFIHGWCKVNRVDEAHWTIQEMKGHGCRPCVISYSTIMQFYCRQGKFDKVYELLDEMQAQACPPNVVTFTTIMCSLAKSEEFEQALHIYDRMKMAGCKPDALFYNALIHTLGRAGHVQEAVRVFEVEMPKTGVNPNTSTYNTVIAMFCHHGKEQKALNVLEGMEKSGLCKPDAQTYYPLLKACFKSGQTGSCLSKLLDDMINKHYLSLDISAYKLLIHGLCRADQCERAYEFLEKMIAQGITPRYQTCRLLLDEVKQKNLYDVSERIEDLMKKL